MCDRRCADVEPEPNADLRKPNPNHGKPNADDGKPDPHDGKPNPDDGKPDANRAEWVCEHRSAGDH